MARQTQSIKVVKVVERIGVIGDVHTERALLATALQHLSQLKLDLLLCTGDLPDGPHEALTVELQTVAGTALLCHGLGDDDMSGVRSYDHGYTLDNNAALQQLLRAGKYRYVINGHTHAPMVRRIGELTVINAGTLLSSQRPCFAVLDFAVRRAQFFSLSGDLQVTAGEEHDLDGTR